MPDSRLPRNQTQFLPQSLGWLSRQSGIGSHNGQFPAELYPHCWEQMLEALRGIWVLLLIPQTKGKVGSCGSLGNQGDSPEAETSEYHA